MRTATRRERQKRTTNLSLLFFAVAAAVASQSVFGATTWRLLRSDSDASGVTNAYAWVSTSSNSTHSGEPGEDLSPNEIYLVRGGYILNTLSGNAQDTVFKGKQLTLGQATTSTGGVRQRSYGAARTTWDNWGSNTGLILAYGGVYEAYTGVGLTSEIYGKVRVNSDASMPYTLSFSYNNTRMNWHGDFTCAADKVLRVAGVNYSSSSNPKPLVSGATLGLLGSLEGFSGTMVVTNATVCVGDGSFPGTLSFEGGGGLSVTNNASDTFTVGNLSMAGDVRLSVSAQLNEDLNAVAANSKIVVTNSFAVSGVVAVSINFSSDITNKVDVPLLVVPLGVALDTEQFSYETAAFTIVTNAEAETQTLVARVSPVVSQTVTDNNDSTGIRDSGPSSITNASHWTDGKVPHAEAHYVVPTSLRLRTPLEKDADYEFPGESLTLRGSTQLGIFNKSAYFKELRLEANSLVMLGGGVANGMIKGQIRLLHSTYSSICAYNTARLDIAADIVGNGRIVLDGSHANTSGRRAYTKFTGDNSRFLGTITVGLNRDPETISAAKFQDLQVADPSKLGAPLPVFNAKALVLKRLGRLAAEGSVTFSDATRGIFIGYDGTSYGGPGASNSAGTDSEGQFSVDEGDTLTILTQLTMNGRLHKYGAGTLALGGPLKFGIDGGDEPLANSNLLAVAQGYVKPLAADSFNGLEMTFAAGTGIKLDINPQDADLRAYGLRNTKAATPFTANGGTIPVSFDVPADFTPEGPFSVGITTVPATTDAEIAAAMAQFSVTSPKVAHCKMSLSAVPHTEEGTVTLMANFRIYGFSLVVR